VIVFHSLTKDEITQIVDLELNKVRARLHEYDIELELTEEARVRLADMGYDPEFGARPLRRVIQSKIEDSLSDALLAGKFEHGDSILIDVDDEDEIVLERKDDVAEAVPAA
jgi:ATP-dependent Clp protease ATP-binding subunit ClpA